MPNPFDESSAFFDRMASCWFAIFSASFLFVRSSLALTLAALSSDIISSRWCLEEERSTALWCVLFDEVILEFYEPTRINFSPE